MTWIARFFNLFRQKRLNEELDEELASHLEEAVERGRSIEEARRVFGTPSQHRERSRDVRLLPWLDAVAADVRFGWRHLNAHRAVTVAAVLSLALGIGAATVAFRLVDAVLLRPLPIDRPEGVFYLAGTFIDRDGRPDYRDDYDYPTFRRYRAAVAGRAELMVVGMTPRQEATFGGKTEAENFYRQYVSGNVFGGGAPAYAE